MINLIYKITNIKVYFPPINSKDISPSPIHDPQVESTVLPVLDNEVFHRVCGVATGCGIAVGH